MKILVFKWPKFTCEGCSLPLELAPADVRIGWIDQNGMEKPIGAQFHFVCVSCGMINPLKRDRVPEAVREAAIRAFKLSNLEHKGGKRVINHRSRSV